MGFLLAHRYTHLAWGKGDNPKGSELTKDRQLLQLSAETVTLVTVLGLTSTKRRHSLFVQHNKSIHKYIATQNIQNMKYFPQSQMLLKLKSPMFSTKTNDSLWPVLGESVA